MKIIFLKYIFLLTACIMLMACGQAGRLYIPKSDMPTQTSPGAKLDEHNTQIRQNAWPR